MTGNQYSVTYPSPSPRHNSHVELSDGTTVSISSPTLQKFLDLQNVIADVEAAYAEAAE